MRNIITSPLSFSIFLLCLCKRARCNLPNEVTDALLKIDGFKNEMDTYGAGVCGHQESTTDLLIVIYSLPEHVEERHTVRKFWPQPNYNQSELRIVFFVRISDGNEYMDTLIREQMDHGDIVRSVVANGDGIMARAISSLMWIYNQCSKAKFVLKIDEKVMVNIPAVLDFVHSNENSVETVWGYVVEKSIYLTKNRETVNELKITVCDKWSFMMTGDMVEKLIILNSNREYFYSTELRYVNEYITATSEEEVDVNITKINDLRFKPTTQDDRESFIYFTSGNEVE